MAETAEKPHNSVIGIDTGRIVELATHMTQDEQFGKFRFRVANRWIDGSRSRTSIKDFHAGGDERTERASALTVDSDQPTYLAGENTAPNAVEHYLNALSSCLSTTLVAHASMQGIEMEALDIAAEGRMDARGFFGVSETVRRGYDQVTVHIRARTTANAETLRQLVNYSPVYEMVSRAVPVEISIAVT